MRLIAKIFVVAVVLAGALLFLAADDVNAATFTLTNANVNSGLTISFIVKAGTLSGSTCDFTTSAAGPFSCFEITYGGSNLVNTFLGVDMFDFNSAALNSPTVDVSNSFTTTGWSSFACPDGTPPLGCEANGFGRFLSEASKPAATDPVIDLALSGSTTISANSNGAMFAVHARFGPNPTTGAGCSLWASDGTANAVGQLETAGCETRRVTEPGTLALLGTALAGMVLALRSRGFELMPA